MLLTAYTAITKLMKMNVSVVRSGHAVDDVSEFKMEEYEDEDEVENVRFDMIQSTQHHI